MGMRCAVWGVRCGVCGMRYAVWGMRYAVCGVGCAVCGVRCAVWGEFGFQAVGWSRNDLCHCGDDSLISSSLQMGGNRGGELENEGVSQLPKNEQISKYGKSRRLQP